MLLALPFLRPERGIGGGLLAPLLTKEDPKGLKELGVVGF